MSTHDQYFSEMNQKYIFKLFIQIIQKDFSMDLSEDLIYKDFFDNSIEKIFNSSNVEDISQLNQILLDYNLDNFKKNQKQSVNDNNQPLLNYEDIINDMNKMNNIKDVEVMDNKVVDNIEDVKVVVGVVVVVVVVAVVRVGVVVVVVGVGVVVDPVVVAVVVVVVVGGVVVVVGGGVGVWC